MELKQIPITSETKCNHCADLCCRYVTQSIPTPKDKHDFNNLLWTVSHENISIYRSKEKDSWVMLVESRCQHLLEVGGCSIYHNRPETCRQHSNDYCEFDSDPNAGFKHHFHNYEELLTFCKKTFKNWK